MKYFNAKEAKNITLQSILDSDNELSNLMTLIKSNAEKGLFEIELTYILNPKTYDALTKMGYLVIRHIITKDNMHHIISWDDSYRG